MSIKKGENAENQELISMKGVDIEYIRLSGHGIQGRWYFEATYQGRVFHIEHQPNSLKFSRAGILKQAYLNSTVKDKILKGMHHKTLTNLVSQISEQVKQMGLYPKMRRSETQLVEDLSGFVASVVLQNCHPEQEIINMMVDRTKKWMEAGFIRPSAKKNAQWYWGSNIEGWWYMTEAPV